MVLEELEVRPSTLIPNVCASALRGDCLAQLGYIWAALNQSLAPEDGGLQLARAWSHAHPLVWMLVGRICSSGKKKSFITSHSQWNGKRQKWEEVVSSRVEGAQKKEGLQKVSWGREGVG